MEWIRFEAPSPDSLPAGGEMSDEREARLLETGEYPDKGLTVTEADLDALVTGFAEGAVPVKLEHQDTAFDPLGVVKQVWREGGALLARLAFPPDLAGFLKRRGIARLSVGLTRDPLTLREVSLVLKPRLASAALLSDVVPFVPVGAELRLRRELQDQVMQGTLHTLKAEGRLTPAAEPLARMLLSAGEDGHLLAFSDSGREETVASVFRRFLETQPPVVVFGETARVKLGQTLTGWTPDEERFLREQIGVSPERAALVRKETGTWPH